MAWNLVLENKRYVLDSLFIIYSRYNYLNFLNFGFKDIICFRKLWELDEYMCEKSIFVSFKILYRC